MGSRAGDGLGSFTGADPEPSLGDASPVCGDYTVDGSCPPFRLWSNKTYYYYSAGGSTEEEAGKGRGVRAVFNMWAVRKMADCLPCPLFRLLVAAVWLVQELTRAQ